MEFRGILSHARDVRAIPLGVDWARTGRIGAYESLFAANGVGRKRAAAAVDAAAAVWPPDAIVSTGFCGALDEKLAVAEIVAGTAIVVSGRSWPASPVSARAPFRSGVVCSVDRVARTAAEKRELRRAGGCIVEMEAAGIVERAESLGIPFHCVRAVTDLAGETLANDYNSALRPDGHFATMLILRGALCQPTVRLPELLRLRSRSVRAARGLGDFIADCRF
jgi:adenosylhomocysteine nucleosidase